MLALLDLRILLVLFLVIALVLLAQPGMLSGDYNRPRVPNDWQRWGMDPPMPGSPPAARGEDKSGRTFAGWLNLDTIYPKNDCGQNQFLGLSWSTAGGKLNDCAPQKVFSQECIKRWTTEYTKRYWRKMWREEGLLESDIAARLAAQGMQWGGVVGIYDEVLLDLTEGTITCAAAP